MRWLLYICPTSLLVTSRFRGTTARCIPLLQAFPGHINRSVVQFENYLLPRRECQRRHPRVSNKPEPALRRRHYGRCVYSVSFAPIYHPLGTPSRPRTSATERCGGRSTTRLHHSRSERRRRTSTMPTVAARGYRGRVLGTRASDKLERILKGK